MTAPVCPVPRNRIDPRGNDQLRASPPRKAARKLGSTFRKQSMEGGSMSTVPTPKAQVRVHIRWMIRRDMPEVLAIEHAGFEYPWCEEECLRVLRQRNCIGMVAEYGERVVGFMI